MGLDATVFRIAAGLHAVLAPQAIPSHASYRLDGNERALAAALEGMQARSGVRLGSANGRFSVTAPPSAGGSFRRTLSGEATRTAQALVLRGEYSSDMFAAASVTCMYMCLASLGLLMALAGLGNMLLGDATEGRGILLGVLPVGLFAAFLALIYRAAAHGGLASQELIHAELTRLEDESSNSASHGA